MTAIMQTLQLIGVLILCSHFCHGQGIIGKPKFPPVFQAEVQGIFKDVKKELSGTLYYDSINRRGSFHFTSEGVTTRSIYRFDDNELLQINGTDCTVSSIKTDSVNRFFPFFIDQYGKTVLAKPEELFFFTDSTFVSEGSDFPSYVYKGKLNSPFYNGPNCEVTHIFTKPELKVPDCESNVCEPTLAAILIKCLNEDGSVKIETTYDFYRFKSNIIDTNVFLPPSGIFCHVTSKNKFPGLPDYFSFSYDVTDDRNSRVLTVHKKVWYDTKMNVLRTDEFDAEGVPIVSRVFDVNSGVAYTSRASLSTCETGLISNEVVPVDEIAKLPKVFFQDKNALSKAVWVGTRRIHGQKYEEWSLLSDNKQATTRIVQDFYFKKSIPKPGVSEIVKLSHAEVYSYQKSISEQPVFTYLPVNNFIDRSRWEAFDVSACFANEQKRRFKLKVEGPPTAKDSKLFQEILNQLYVNLIRATNISAIRLNDLACGFDGVRIVEFSGLLLDKPKVINSDAGKSELDLNEAYRMIDYLAKDRKLSLRISKDGQIVDYKITSIEDIKPEEEEDKNLYSGGVVAGCVFGCTPLAIFIGAFISIKIRKKLDQDENDCIAESGSVELPPMKS
ncbi:uncharacterized protein LOC129963701 isoform X1 [Argiope bruennichi]|uniref:uncharacterized protein LOC129963701 isoform X1 n=1 Tax=Argiope bruennichi TaxID=94029 RepID=UPI0024958DDF|nr:uncharacterized protein LOC129963701 isoform X1 [Argiope bruennichi]